MGLITTCFLILWLIVGIYYFGDTTSKDNFWVYTLMFLTCWVLIINLVAVLLKVRDHVWRDTKQKQVTRMNLEGDNII